MLWRVVQGSLRDAGFLSFRSANLLIDGTLKGEQSIPERETSCLSAAITGVGTPSVVGTSA